MAMNVHHLELFYYVARYGGITAAVRRMPYGIQQPAVSGQMIQLESDLGVTLFRRRPFALTREGEVLFAYAKPFFSQMEDVAAALCDRAGSRLRVAASPMVLGEHLPEVFKQLRDEVPGLRLSLRGLGEEPVEELLGREVDVVLSVTNKAPASVVKVLPLLKLPLVILVPESVKERSFEALSKSGRVDYPLVAPPAAESLVQLFQKHLAGKRMTWETHVEVGALQLVESYVAGGFGLGLSVEVPGARLPDGVRALRVKGCPPLQLGVLTAGKLKPVAERFVELVQVAAREIGGVEREN